MKKKMRRTTRRLYLPGWVKLRMGDDLKGQTDWMISSAEDCDADSVTIRLRLKNRPWMVSLSVKRDYSKRV